MLKSLNSLRGQSLTALDGEIGRIKDALFDDQQWGVRYLVVSTGDWLSGRDVLISPNSIESPSPNQTHLNIRLTREQVQNSPDVDFEKPIPRRVEEEFYSYYGWTPYWVGFPLELFPSAMMMGETREDVASREEREPGSTPAAEEVLPRQAMSHLRSAREIEGYHLHATDGDIGHLIDYLIDSDTWQIQSIIADTKNWFAGKKVILPVSAFERIDWYNRLARTRLTRAEIKAAKEFVGVEGV
ncbi:MAG TPA: PRC-barrel domain-containing protein [Opitutaceae bacterium]